MKAERKGDKKWMKKDDENIREGKEWLRENIMKIERISDENRKVKLTKNEKQEQFIYLNKV